MSLLSVEWLKIKRYRTFWVLIGLFALLLPVWNYEIANGSLQLGGSSKQSINLLNNAYTFPDVWANIGYWGSIFVMFISILVIILTTNEYTYRTHRQNIIDGWTRMQFYHAKVLLVLALSVAVTAYVLVLGLLFGRAHSGNFEHAMDGIRTIPYFFVLTLDYALFGLLLAVLIKRSGLAIGLFILYTLILENIGKGVINSYMDTPYGNLLPLQASDELIPIPLWAMAKKMMGQVEKISANTYLIVSLCWCSLYYLLGRLMLLRRDL